MRVSSYPGLGGRRTLEVATGKVIGSLHRRHRAVEFKKFLTKLDKEVQKKLKPGVHRSVQALERDIRSWLADWNEHPSPFAWTKTADEIFHNVAAYCRRISDSDH
ncbi:hypothetical protein OH780_00185 [Streptomyces decoyicus]